MMKPDIAPATVPSSSSTANLKLVRWSLRNLAAAPEEVATIEIRLAAIAYRMSTPRNNVKTGTTMIPPPSPNSAPRKPPKIDMRKSMREYMLSI